jgi:cellobiose phosphorylase
MHHVLRQQSLRLCAAVAPAAISADGGTDDELKQAREAAREQAAQWVAAHPQIAVAAAQTGADAPAAL